MMLARTLAAAARAEQAAREGGYPAMVAAGTIAQPDADRDIAAWRAIAELLEARSTATHLTRAELLDATAAALARREQALAAAPADRRPALTTRRDLVEAIHRRLTSGLLPIPLRDLMPAAEQQAAA